MKRLGCLPLALVQAGKYIKETKGSCLKYLDLYESPWSKLVAEVPRLRDYENGSIQTTWMISYERVKHANPTAAKLLQLWAYLDHQEIWYELFSRGRQGCPECLWLQDLARDEISFMRAVKMLLAYSLVESHESTGSYSIHPVVHEWCAETISYGGVESLTLAFLVVGFAVPVDSEREYWLLQQRLVPHADRCMRQLDKYSVPDLIEYSRSSAAFHSFGLLCADQGKLAEAEKMYRRALDGYEKLRGPNHPTTKLISRNLSSILGP